jgi:hypothetical protein
MKKLLLFSFENRGKLYLNASLVSITTGKSVNIITTHIVGRGYDHLNSITRVKSFSSAVETFYKSNFKNIPVSVEDEISEPIVSSFQLYQSYPNPFNPITNISFYIPDFGFVSLKVYDVLGNEIAALVNEEKPAGSYEVQFDGSSLSSGIYFYQLRTMPVGRQTEKFSSVKKMILLK